MIDFITPIIIAGLASAIGSILTILLTFWKKRKKYETFVLKDDFHRLIISKENVDLIESILSGSEELKSAMKNAISKERRCIDIADISLYWLLDDEIVAIIKNAISKGVRVRILLAHPGIARFREQQEGRESGALAREVIESLRRLMELRTSLGPHSSYLEIHVTKGLLTSFMVITTDRILIKPYIMTSAFSSTSFVISLKAGDERFQRIYEEAFGNLWNQSETTKIISEEAGVAAEQLNNLSKYSTIIIDDYIK